MGLPFGPTLANVLLMLYEKQWLKDCIKIFTVLYYRCCVDDIFVLFNLPKQLLLFCS